MADLALVTANKVDVVESLEQHTAPAGANIVAGQGVSISPTNGRWVLATNARIYGIATRSVRTGEPLTAIRTGVLGGLELGALAYDADVFVNTANGNLADAGTVAVGRVLPGYYNMAGRPHDKILLINIH